MALSDPYAWPTEYRARISPNTDDAKDDAILEDLIAVSRFLEGKLDRFFGKDDIAVTREFIVPGDPMNWMQSDYLYTEGQLLKVDDMSGVPDQVLADVDNDGVFETELLSTGWECRPLNADKGGEPQPFDGIMLLPRGRQFLIPKTHFQVSVPWGFPAMPLGVKVATIHLTALLRLESDRATRRIPTDIDQVAETSYDAIRILRDLLEHYKQPWGLV